MSGVHHGRAGERAEAAVGAGDDVLAADDFRIAHQPLRDQLRMFDVVGGRIQNTRNDHFSIRQPDVFEDGPFVLVARVGAFK